MALSLPRRDTADAQCLGTHPKYLHDEALWLGKVQQCVHCAHAGVFFSLIILCACDLVKLPGAVICMVSTLCLVLQ